MQVNVIFLTVDSDSIKKKYLTLKCSTNDLKFMKYVMYNKIILIISEGKGKWLLKIEFQRIKGCVTHKNFQTIHLTVKKIFL